MWLPVSYFACFLHDPTSILRHFCPRSSPSAASDCPAPWQISRPPGPGPGRARGEAANGRQPCGPHEHPRRPHGRKGLPGVQVLGFLVPGQVARSEM